MCYLVVGGAPIHWSSTRQPFICRRSAERELVATLEGVAVGESYGEVVAELVGRMLISPVDMVEESRGNFGEPLKLVLYCDNAATVTILSSPQTCWRTRHLRIRSGALRERIPLGMWHVHHLEVVHSAADLGTKALTAPRVFHLCSLLGLGPCCNLVTPSLKKLSNNESDDKLWRQVMVVGTGILCGSLSQPLNQNHLSLGTALLVFGSPLQQAMCPQEDSHQDMTEPWKQESQQVHTCVPNRSSAWAGGLQLASAIPSALLCAYFRIWQVHACVANMPSAWAGELQLASACATPCVLLRTCF